MAHFNEVVARTMVAVQNLKSTKHHILRASAAGECQVASNPGGGAAEIIGIQWSKADSGENVAVAYQGEAKVVAGSAAVSANVPITSNSSGRAVAATSGDWMLGHSLEASTSDGEVIRCLLGMPAVHVPSSLAASV